MSNVNLRRPFVIGIAGGTGSGKTSVVNEIVKSLNNNNVVVIQHDFYYRDRSHIPFEDRKNINFDHPDALETDLLIQHLKDLMARRKISIPAYDLKTHTRKKAGVLIAAQQTIIVEGILIFVEKRLRELMDVKIFVDTDDDIRFIRRIQRDMNDRGRSIESVISQYLETVRPMHIEFVEPSKKYADVIIPEGHNPVALDMVVSMIQNRLNF